MITLTLDTNCLIDVAEERPAATHVLALLDAFRHGVADVALVASSASERQQSGEFLSSLSLFNDRRTALGFGELQLLPSIGRWGLTFFDHSLWASDEGVAREKALYEKLFPSSQYEWADYAASKGASLEDQTSPTYYRWRNMLLDAQAVWAHDHAEREVFVTSDLRLRVLNGDPQFSPMVVRTPEEAVSEI